MPFIQSVGVALPENEVGSAQLSEIFGVDEDWIEMFVGTKSRYLSFDFSQWRPTLTLEELTAQAAADALAKAGLKIGEIGAIILATATPDQLIPATVNRLADRLGANDVLTYQIQCGCVGALQAINFGRQLLASEDVDTCLVVGGDVCSKFIPDRVKCRDLEATEIVNYLLFGDGAGAIVLTRVPVSGSLEIAGSFTRFSGLGIRSGQEVNWLGADAARVGEVALLREDYKAIRERVPAMTDKTLNEVLERYGLVRENVDHFLLPQLSKRMSDEISGRLGIPSGRAIQVVERIGNNGNALAFFQLAELKQAARPGETAIAIAIESSKWLTGALYLKGTDQCRNT